MDKKTLRKQKMYERDSLSFEEIQALSDIITERIVSLKEYKEVKKILTFVSCKSEVITDNLINKALKDSKIVGVPKVEGDSINFYRIYSLDELAPGYFGVREPAVCLPENILDVENSLILVPGLAFDTELNRIGYGKGYYDRFFLLNAGKKFVRCGIAFDMQICEKIDKDRYDQPLDMIVTEKKVIVR